MTQPNPHIEMAAYDQLPKTQDRYYLMWSTCQNDMPRNRPQTDQGAI